MSYIEALLNSRFIGWIFRHRFIKFGTVGGSGVLINLGVLYLGQEYLFTAIESPSMRLNVSLGLAILCATGNNFTWNRLWTWEDRRHGSDKPLLLQFGQYTLACLFGILLQLAFTKILAAHVHYLLANFTAILAAGIFNYWSTTPGPSAWANCFRSPPAKTVPFGSGSVSSRGSPSSPIFSDWTASTSPRTAMNTPIPISPA